MVEREERERESEREEKRRERQEEARRFFKGAEKEIEIETQRDRKIDLR